VDQIARPGSVVTLQFRVVDDREVAQGTPASPPASFTVVIGPQGSVPPTLTSVQNNLGNDASSTDRRYTYTWTVPSAPSFTTFGYFINVSDSVGNWRVLEAESVIMIGRWSLKLH